MDANDADDAWSQLQGETLDQGGGLAPGDVVYVADVYHELDGDGRWAVLPPGGLTKRLYELATSAEGTR
jgi:hypothetical protein